MTEPTPTPEPTDSPEEKEGNEPEALDVERATKKINKLNSEAANLRARLKELEPLAAKAKELEEAGRSDLEKLTARAETAERERGEHAARAVRLEVAFEKGLTPAQAKRLVGSSREELEADADEILRDFPVKADRFSGGADQGTRTTTKKPAASLDEAIAVRIAAGKSR